MLELNTLVKTCPGKNTAIQDALRHLFRTRPEVRTIARQPCARTLFHAGFGLTVRYARRANTPYPAER
ncbi:MAG: hypothetical protein GY862_32950 [Gammaproteobacteria bacterium]|nr:hypothetical protein [Gammaproteobacteria bacterium]